MTASLKKLLGGCAALLLAGSARAQSGVVIPKGAANEPAPAQAASATAAAAPEIRAPQTPAPESPAAQSPAAPPVGAPDAEVLRIHVVEKRPFTEEGRSEISLFAPVQVNPKFTVHAGVAAEFAYHLRENLALQLGVTWFPLSVESSLTEELVSKVKQQPLAANALLLQGDAVAGIELMPVYGKLNVFDGKILRLGVYLNAGLGAAKTRLQLRPASSSQGRSFGDTGVRPMGELGLGVRIFLNEQFTIRLELRDLVYSAYVSRVNGCNFADTKLIANPPAGSPTLSSGCSAGAFGGDPKEIMGNAAIASDQLKDPSADVINNLAFQGGLSYLF